MPSNKYLNKIVVLRKDGLTKGVGVVDAYRNQPQIFVTTSTGERVWWPANQCEIVELPEDVRQAIYFSWRERRHEVNDVEA